MVVVGVGECRGIEQNTNKTKKIKKNLMDMENNMTIAWQKRGGMKEGTGG